MYSDKIHVETAVAGWPCVVSELYRKGPTERFGPPPFACLEPISTAGLSPTGS
jgi:hypothetical protein